MFIDLYLNKLMVVKVRITAELKANTGNFAWFIVGV